MSLCLESSRGQCHQGQVTFDRIEVRDIHTGQGCVASVVAQQRIQLVVVQKQPAREFEFLDGVARELTSDGQHVGVGVIDLSEQDIVAVKRNHNVVVREAKTEGHFVSGTRYVHHGVEALAGTVIVMVTASAAFECVITEVASENVATVAALQQVIAAAAVEFVSVM